MPKLTRPGCRVLGEELELACEQMGEEGELSLTLTLSRWERGKQLPLPEEAPSVPSGVRCEGLG
jgi:hypothetical protein